MWWAALVMAASSSGTFFEYQSRAAAAAVSADGPGGDGAEDSGRRPREQGVTSRFALSSSRLGCAARRPGESCAQARVLPHQRCRWCRRRRRRRRRHLLTRASSWQAAGWTCAARPRMYRELVVHSAVPIGYTMNASLLYVHPRAPESTILLLHCLARPLRCWTLLAINPAKPCTPHFNVHVASKSATSK
jgi:hypothetical protein